MTDFNRYPPSRLPSSSPKAFPRIGKGLVESFYSAHYKQVDFHGQKKDSILIKNGIRDARRTADICIHFHPGCLAWPVSDLDLEWF